MTLYILNLNGAEAGPFTEQQLRALWLTGGITVNTDWRFAPDGEWQNGAELPNRLELVSPKRTDVKAVIAIQILLLLIALVGVVILARPQRSSPVTWDYEEIEVPLGHDYTTTFALRGDSDFVGSFIVPATGSQGGSTNVLIFRKPRKHRD